MKSRHKKLALIGGALAIIGIIAALVLNALNSNIALYISPTDVPPARRRRASCSASAAWSRKAASSAGRWRDRSRFVVTDTAKDIPVDYKGILPDLFKEGKGVVAQGKMTGPTALFTASEVLAKHDENYMPPEAAKAVDDAQKASRPSMSRPLPPRATPESELLSMIPELGISPSSSPRWSPWCSAPCR
jgi:cytochrome c-type biogenesis protein CcmE